MKTNILIKWLTGLRKGLGLAGARLASQPIPSLLAERAVRRIPVEVLPEACFTPRINFRRPELDSLHEAGFARIELSLRARRPRPA